MYLYIYIYKYIYIYIIYIYIYIYKYINIYIYMYICIYVYIYMCIMYYVYIYINILVYIYIHVPLDSHFWWMNQWKNTTRNQLSKPKTAMQLPRVPPFVGRRHSDARDRHGLPRVWTLKTMVTWGCSFYGPHMAMDWFVGENLHRKPMGFYHQI